MHARRQGAQGSTVPSCAYKYRGAAGEIGFRIGMEAGKDFETTSLPFIFVVSLSSTTYPRSGPDIYSRCHCLVALSLAVFWGDMAAPSDTSSLIAARDRTRSTCRSSRDSVNPPFIGRVSSASVAAAIRCGCLRTEVYLRPQGRNRRVSDKIVVARLTQHSLFENRTLRTYSRCFNSLGAMNGCVSHSAATRMSSSSYFVFRSPNFCIILRSTSIVVQNPLPQTGRL